MLETIREYAAERLEASGHAEALRRRLPKWLLALALSANLQLESEGDERHDLVVSELPNIRAAIDLGDRHGPRGRRQLLLAPSSSGPSGARSRRDAGWTSCSDAAPYPDELQARLLAIYGGLIFLVGDFEEGGRPSGRRPVCSASSGTSAASR